MSEQIEQIEEEPVEVSIMRAINRGVYRVEQVKWDVFLSGLLNTIGQMEKPVSYIGCTWALLNEIDDFNQRNDILDNLQHVATVCFPSQEAVNAFVIDTGCLMRINSRLHQLVLMNGAQIPHIYGNVGRGKGLNEMALVWSRKYIDGKNIVALASEIHTSVQSGEKAPVIEHFLCCSRQYDKLPFGNICEFGKSLFLAESFRQHLVEGKMYTPAPITFGDFSRKLRNACFDEYIRLRLEKIKEEKDNDNWQLLDPTEEDCYRQLYKEEKCIADREWGFEQFRGSIAYSRQWYNGRPEVLNMIKYFMDYLDWKMANLQDKNVRTGNTQIINGDYVAGNKIMGDVIGNVEAGGVGKQVSYGLQTPDVNTSATGHNPEPQAPTPEDECRGELFKFIHYSVIDDKEKVAIHKQICNIIQYPKISLVIDALKEMKNDKKIVSSIEPAVMLAELRRLGLPSDKKGFSDQNFFSAYSKF